MAANVEEEEIYLEEGEGEGDEEGEGEYEEEENDEEPQLKYQRLGSSVSDILNRDAASCMAVHEKFLALGTHWGVVHILDFYGNEIKRFPVHTATVNDLSIDFDGEYIASCSDDGKVVISGLYTQETLEYVYHRPVKAVALDPTFKNDNRHFCTGGLAGQLITNKKGWFGSKDTVLHDGEGPIYAIKWSGTIIAWANDLGVKMYDCRTKQRITFIDRPKNSPRADLFRCHLCWENETTLLIGWADCWKICLVKEKEKLDLSAGLPARYVEIIAVYQTDYYISGIAPYKDNLAVLTFIEEPNGGERGEGGGASRPELRIITRSNVEVSSDALSVHGWEHYHSTDYRLEHLSSESLFYVVSPKDIVVAKPRDLDDHISWLLERERYEEALAAAEAGEKNLRHHKLEAIGGKVIEHLINVGDITRAAAVCPKILKQDAKRWEKWIFCFANISQLQAIVPYIPISNPQLSKTVYEMVLGFFLLNDNEGFLKTIRKWPHDADLYSIQNIINGVLDRLKLISTDTVLMDALAELYTYDGKFDKALFIYLTLGRGDVFELIRMHNLYEAVQDKVIQLMKFDQTQAIQMLIDNTNKIAIEKVVSQLEGERKLLHDYLHALFVKDSHIGSDFHVLQVPLYADYAYDLLLPFLKQSNYYPLETALEVCRQRHLYKEMVFILRQMGNNKLALELIIDQLRDVHYAIEFVTDVNDDELWDDLIDKSVHNAEFVGGLLENIGSHVDPIKLIQRIPDDLEIIGLRDKLVKIISDYNLQKELREGCKRILVHDCIVLADRLNRTQKRALSVVDGSQCPICNDEVLSSRSIESLVPFFCGHIYHELCIAPAGLDKSKPSQQQVWCTMCMNDEKQASKKKVAAKP